MHIEALTRKTVAVSDCYVALIRADARLFELDRMFTDETHALEYARGAAMILRALAAEHRFDEGAKLMGLLSACAFATIA